MTLRSNLSTRQSRVMDVFDKYELGEDVPIDELYAVLGHVTGRKVTGPVRQMQVGATISRLNGRFAIACPALRIIPGKLKRTYRLVERVL